MQLIYKINDPKREQLSSLIDQSLDLLKQRNEPTNDGDFVRPTDMPTATTNDPERVSAIRVLSSNSAQSAASQTFSPSVSTAFIFR